MPDVLRVPADLTPILRASAIHGYYSACDAGQRIADDDERDHADLRDCRRAVIAADHAMDLVGDDVTTAEAIDVPLDERNRKILGSLIDRAIDQRIVDAIDMSPDEDNVLAAAAWITRLRGLLDAEGATA